MANGVLLTETLGAWLLRNPEVRSQSLATLLTRLGAREDLSDVLEGRPSLTREPQCVECALRVMRDLEPLPTVAEHEALVQSGKWSHRRERRRRRVRRSPAPIRFTFGV